jgi:hypothetical protein
VALFSSILPIARRCSGTSKIDNARNAAVCSEIHANPNLAAHCAGHGISVKIARKVLTQSALYSFGTQN